MPAGWTALLRVLGIAVLGADPTVELRDRQKSHLELRVV
jgi:hypothetical protein